MFDYNVMSNYLSLENQWKVELSSLSNTELIERFNQEVYKKGWTSSRALWWSICIQEMKKRQWNLENVMVSNWSNPYSEFKINLEIKLINQNVIVAK